MEDRAAVLAEKIWVTKGARFNAHRRLNAKHYSSLTATALMSVYVVFLQLVPMFLGSAAAGLDERTLSLLTSFLAIAILVLSLLEQGKSYQLRAERLHMCGMALNRLYDELENERAQVPAVPASLLDDISQRYHEALRSVPENHDPIDNDVFRAQHREHFKVGRLALTRTYVSYYLGTRGLAWLLTVAFPAATVLWIW